MFKVYMVDIDGISWDKVECMKSREYIFIIDYVWHLHFNGEHTPYGLVGNENFLSHTILWFNF